MASVSTVSKDVFSKTLTLSKAEKAFQPWWGSLENYLLYSIIMIAVMLLQTDRIKGTSMDCTFCQSNYCNDSSGFTYNQTGIEDPQFNFKWVRQQCTSPALDRVRYYPYLLILQGIILLVSKKFTTKIFSSGKKMKKLYEFTTLVWREKTELGSEKDLNFDAIHLKDQLRNSCDYYYGYLLEAGSLLTLASGFVFIIFHGKYWRNFMEANQYICRLHGYYYECHGMPFRMYLWSFYMTTTMMILLILLQIYNILWMCFPSFNKLSREMRNYKKNLFKNLQKQQQKKITKKNTKELLGDLYDIYYKGKDLAFLLNILASSSGIAESLSVMTVLDQKFRDNLTPRIESANRTVDDGKAEIILKRENCGLKYADLMHVAQISPPTNENSVQIIGKHQVKLTFIGLKSTEEYTVNIFSAINGKRIHEATENIVARDALERPSLLASPSVNNEDKELTLISFDTQADKASFTNIAFRDSD